MTARDSIGRAGAELLYEKSIDDESVLLSMCAPLLISLACIATDDCVRIRACIRACVCELVCVC